MFKHSAVSGLGCQKYGPSLRFVTLCASVVTHTKTFIAVRGVIKILVFEKRFNHSFSKKIKVHLSSLMMKVPDHVYVLG
jgi:hypothetical protein